MGVMAVVSVVCQFENESLLAGQLDLLDSLVELAGIDTDVASSGGVHFEHALALLLLADFEGGSLGG